MYGTSIILEGIDGSGKTTQAHRLVAQLQEEGYAARYVRAPGETPIGLAIREIVLEQDPPLYQNLYTRQMLFLADHNELINAVMAPAIRAGAVVVADRFLDSTFAYAVGGLGLDPRRLQLLIAGCVTGIPSDLVDRLPGLSLLLDMPVNHARERLDNRNKADLWDGQGEDYYTRIQKEYYRIYPLAQTKDCYVDALADVDTVHASILQKALKHIRSLDIPRLEKVA
jgi:dTMP kinase